MKQYSELTFTDNFMFCKIMTEYPDICRRVIELILGKKIKSIHIKGAEQELEITPDAKGIRLDVYLDDENGTIYDLEMQTSVNRNLAKRSRYYASIMDLKAIERGDRYEKLPEAIVIFICTFDYFKQGLPIYLFENRCVNLLNLQMADETKKIFVNPYGDESELSAELKAFLKLIRENQATDEFTSQISSAVADARTHQKWEVEYMQWRANEMDHESDLELAEARGIEKGIEKRTFLVDAIKQMKNGRTEAQLKDAGFDDETISLAKSCI